MQKRLLLLLVAGLAVVASLLAWLMYTTTMLPACNLTSEPPKSANTSSKLVDSYDETALVSFQGYLEFKVSDKDEKDIYLALDLRDASTVRSDDGESTRSLILDTDCAEVTFILSVSNKQVHVDAIKVKLRRDHKGMQIFISRDSPITIDEDKYYSCKKGSYSFVNPISVLDETVMTLKISDIKIELDRDPKTSNSGVFSKKEQKCLL